MSVIATSWVGQKLGSTPYRAIRLLGKGGMALVYLAEDLHTQRSVVIKTPRLDVCDPNLLARFREETRAARVLQHPNIVPLLDAAEHEDTPFLVLPYLEGGTLLERIQSGQHANVPLATWLQSWLPAVANALDYLHGLGWIHRDVKPANIFFDAHGVAYLGDLGLTKTVFAHQGQGLTKLGGPSPGTPRYMAPETLLGRPADGRADQFSLAVLLYECLTGRSPYAGDTPWDVKKSQSQTLLIPAHEWNPTLPRNVHPVIARGLALDPERRYPCCRQLSAEVCMSIPTPQPSPTSSNPASWSLHDEVIPAAATALPASLTPSTSMAPSYYAQPWPASYPMMPQPTYLAPPPGRLGRWFRGTLLFAVGITIGGLFLPGTPLHQKLAEPAARWIEENAGWTLPWFAKKQAAKEEKKEPGAVVPLVAREGPPAIVPVPAREERAEIKELRSELSRVQDLLSKEKERVVTIEGVLEKETQLRIASEGRVGGLEADVGKWKTEAEKIQRTLSEFAAKKEPPAVYRTVPFTLKTALRRDDPFDPIQRNHCKPIEVHLVAGKTYVVDMTSADFDTYLRLVSPSGVQVAYDDDTGEGLNARIEYRPLVTGIHRVFCTSYRDVTGNFTLQVREK